MEKEENLKSIRTEEEIEDFYMNLLADCARLGREIHRLYEEEKEEEEKEELHGNS